MNENISIIKIGDTDIFLEELGENIGKITVSDISTGYNNSAMWGAMDGTLKDFLQRIDCEYFSGKMTRDRRETEMDVSKTFFAIRKHIADEILPWDEHIEFQKNMRKVLSSFEANCQEINSPNYFVDNFFSSFVNSLDFWLIQSKWERDKIESSFKNISEHWYFIVLKPNREVLWLRKLHGELKEYLHKQNEMTP